MRKRRYTRIIVAALAVALIAAACHDKDGRHWPRSSGTQTVIYIDTANVQPHIRGMMEYAADVWSRSSRLDIRVRNSCPTGSNCVRVHQASGPTTAWATTWFIGDHYTRASITFQGNWGAVSLQRAAFAACHEPGHVIGFAHWPGTTWPCNWDTMRPDRHEYESVADIYRHTDSSGPPGV